MIPRVAAVIAPFVRAFNYLSPVGDLIARIWVAQIFFMSGLVKIHAWQSTVMLFAHVYNVPYLSPYVAAVIGTAAELILPILLTIGLGGRITIFIFFVYNIIAAASYPFLWTPQGWNGLSQHIAWGLLLALLMTYGPGKLSLDYWIRKVYGHHLKKQ